MHLAKCRFRLALLKNKFSLTFENSKFLHDKNLSQGISQSKIEDPLTLVQPQVFNLEIWMMRFLIASMS